MRSDAGHRGLVGDPSSDVLDLVERDRVEQLDHAIGVDVLAEHDGLAGGEPGDGAGALRRQDVAAGGVRAGEFQLVGGGAVGAELAHDLAHPRVGLHALAGFQARAERELCAIGVHVLEAPHRVTEAALLAQLVEEARAHRAAEDRAVEAQRCALARTRRVDLRLVDQAEVRLLVSRSSTRVRAVITGKASLAAGLPGAGKRSKSSPSAASSGRWSRLPTR